MAWCAQRPQLSVPTSPLRLPLYFGCLHGAADSRYTCIRDLTITILLIEIGRSVIDSDYTTKSIPGAQG